MKIARKSSQRLFYLLMFISFLFIPNALFSQSSVTIKGKVTDITNHSALPGVTVTVQGTTIGTITDVNGNYTLNAEPQQTLQFSFIGMETKLIKVGNSKTLNVELSSASIGVDEVVVTALGIKREKKSLGYSVQEVKGDKLAKAREVNVANSLQGKVSGIQVTQSGTGTGGGSRITIRGNSSLSGNNEPLVVIDGVPMTDYSSSTDDVWGNRAIDRGDGIGDINPDDIESMSVLKGPAAAALYGSRAGNGVILITTKQGAKGDKFFTSINTNLVIETPLTIIDLQNQYGQGTGGKFINSSGDSWGAKMEGQTVRDWTGNDSKYTGADNDIRDFLNPGVNWTNSVTISSNTQKNNFMGSYSRMDYWGQIPSNRLNRNTINLRNVLQVTDKLKVDMKLNWILSQGENRPKLAGDPDNIYLNYANMPRNIRFDDMKDYRNSDLTPRSYNADNNTSMLNPYWTINLNTNWDDRDRIIALAQISYEFNEWLNARVRYGIDYYYLRGYDQLGTGAPYWITSGDVRQTVDSFREENADFLVTAHKDEFASKFSGSFSVGGNLMRQNGMSSTQSANGLIVPDFYSINNALDPRTTTDYTKKGINSIYLMGQISWDNYLYVDATFRGDWSSTLPKDNRSYFYPSVGIGWVLSEMIDLPEWTNYLKVRGSWAMVGNDTDPYKLSEYGTTQIVGGSGVPGISLPDQKPFSDLKPEDVRSWEIGAEGSFFDNRLGFDFTYYNMHSYNQIMPVQQPAATGYTTHFINAGDIANRGVEIMARGTVVRTSDFNWDMTMNWTRNRNKVVELSDQMDTYIMSQDQAQVQIISFAGGNYGDLYGTYYQRDDEGNLLLDSDNLPVVSQDLKVIGNMIPKWNAGISNSFSYKGISLSFLFDFQKGGNIFSGSAKSAAALGTLKQTEEGRDAYYSGTGGYHVVGVNESGNKVDGFANPESYWKRVASVNEEWVYDATNVRLRELTASYSLPSSWLESTPLSKVTFSFVGRNLWLLKNNLPGIDPESSYSQSNASSALELGAVPSARTTGFNIKVDL